MTRQYSPAIAELAKFGIHFQPEVVDSILAMDAQTPLVTTSNSGVPAWMTNYYDPKVIEVLTARNEAANILGETKKGDWTSSSLTFNMVEYTGEVSSYGDYNNNGSSGINQQFPERQPYHYQTITQWGERQIDVSDLTKLDYASRINMASVNVLNKFQNDTYFYGVAGLKNYGLLNDPSLPASVAPGPKAFNSGASGPWITAGSVTATANEIYADVQNLYAQLVSQTAGLVRLKSKMVLALSPVSETALLTTNSFNVSVEDLLRKNFPNLRIESAQQYLSSSGSGNTVQLIAEDIEGQETGSCVFTEKLRAHKIVVDLSAYKQKKSQGTVGAVIFQPNAIATMVGV